MNTPEWPGQYELRRQVHFDICRTYKMSIQNCDRTITASHPGWELLLVRDGQLQMEIEGRAHRVARGEALLFNSQLSHTEIHRSDLHTNIDGVVFHPQWLELACAELRINPNECHFLTPKSSAGQNLHALMKTLLNTREWEPSAPSYDSIATDLVYHLLKVRNHSSSHLIKRAESRNYGLSVTRAKRVMRDNLQNPELTLDEIAKECGMSKFHFTRSFRRLTGVSPYQYLLSLRMDCAKAALRTCSKNSQEVATLVGFRELDTFLRAFKRVVGVSPCRYVALVR